MAARGAESEIEQIDWHSGKPRLTLTLPDCSTLENFAQTLATLLAAGGSKT